MKHAAHAFLDLCHVMAVLFTIVLANAHCGGIVEDVPNTIPGMQRSISQQRSWQGEQIYQIFVSLKDNVKV